MAPALPFIVGIGFVVGVPAAVLGFVLAVRTRLTPRALLLVVGGTTALVTGGAVASPAVRAVPAAAAFAVLLFFPVYALFWTLHDFVETTVR